MKTLMFVNERDTMNSVLRDPALRDPSANVYRANLSNCKAKEEWTVSVRQWVSYQDRCRGMNALERYFALMWIAEARA